MSLTGYLQPPEDISATKHWYVETFFRFSFQFYVLTPLCFCSGKGQVIFCLESPLTTGKMSRCLVRNMEQPLPQNKIQMLKLSGTAVSRSPGWYKSSAHICVRGIWWDTSLIISVTYSHWLFTDVCGGSSLQNFYIFCGNANNCRCSEPYRLFTSSSTSLFSDFVGTLKLLLLPPGVLQPSGAVWNSLRQRVNPTGDCNHI